MRFSFLLFSLFVPLWEARAQTASWMRQEAQIHVDTTKLTGTVSPYLFGRFIEHEHNTIQGWLWAELLRDRKFEQGDADQVGVSNGWVPQATN